MAQMWYSWNRLRIIWIKNQMGKYVFRHSTMEQKLLQFSRLWMSKELSQSLNNANVSWDHPLTVAFRERLRLYCVQGMQDINKSGNLWDNLDYSKEIEMLSDQAMIATLTAATWSGKKYDHKTTEEVVKQKKSDQKAGRFNKTLLPNDPQLAKIKKAMSEMRGYHYANTLPWEWRGGQLLPGAHFMEYSKHMEDLIADFEKEVDKFLDPKYYDQAKLSAQKQLGNLFDPNDYPSIDELRQQFYASVTYDPVPSSGDFRVDIEREELNKLKAKWVNREAEITQKATQHLWEKLSKLIDHAKDRLSDPDKVFHNTLPKNIAEFTKLLDGLNIGGDLALSQLGKEASKLGQYSAEELRKDPTLRADAAQHAADVADKIKQQMGAFMK